MQAIDATPQEESSSMCRFDKNKMQCGPASLEAVRRETLDSAMMSPSSTLRLMLML